MVPAPTPMCLFWGDALAYSDHAANQMLAG
jgi:hypothetical protein